MPIFLEWTPEWRSGDYDTDAAHRGLVRQANAFLTGLDEKQPETVLKEILQQMIDAAGEHFRAEEKGLRKDLEPEAIAIYQRERDRLLEELRMLGNGFWGAKLGVDDVHPFFHDWFACHLKIMHPR